MQNKNEFPLTMRIFLVNASQKITNKGMGVEKKKPCKMSGFTKKKKKKLKTFRNRYFLPNKKNPASKLLFLMLKKQEGFGKNFEIN